jgi:hypothetical protein
MQQKHIDTDFTPKQLRHMMNWGSAVEKRLARQMLELMMEKSIFEKMVLSRQHRLDHLDRLVQNTRGDYAPDQPPIELGEFLEEIDEYARKHMSKWTGQATPRTGKKATSENA